MTFTIFKVSQLLKSGTIHAMIQGAVVLCLQHWELGCLPESLCWLQAPSLSIFPVITSVNEDRCIMLSLQAAYKGDVGSPCPGREQCGTAWGHLALPRRHCPTAACPTRPCPGGAETFESKHGPGGLLGNSLIPGDQLLPGIMSNCMSSPDQCSLLGLPCSELSV